jgi:uncharacterized protein (DUF433 family)
MAVSDLSFVSAFEGCYEADRASALSGVPVSTVYDWARKGVVAPTMSDVRPKRWSYADLMALRIVHWLRHPKVDDDAVYPASPMPEVKRALHQLAAMGIDLWNDASPRRSALQVNRGGNVVIVDDGTYADAAGQGVLDVLDLLGPFETPLTNGPDLVRPRPHLRIVPGKVAGEPHVQHSRLTTLTIAALADRGYDLPAIAAFYPEEDPEGINEAIDLETSLAANLRSVA